MQGDRRPLFACLIEGHLEGGPDLVREECVVQPLADMRQQVGHEAVVAQQPQPLQRLKLSWGKLVRPVFTQLKDLEDGDQFGGGVG